MNLGQTMRLILSLIVVLPCFCLAMGPLENEVLIVVHPTARFSSLGTTSGPLEVKAPLEAITSRFLNDGKRVITFVHDQNILNDFAEGRIDDGGRKYLSILPDIQKTEM